MANENSPLVSVIIPMYNTEKYISECLQSLLNQTLENIEVIVVDDCSSDNSLAVAENFIPAFESKNKALILAKLSQNSGRPGIPRNFALDLAKGKYIYFLDSDDFLDATALEEFFNVAEKFKADVVHSEICFTLQEDNPTAEKVMESTQSGEFVEVPTLETMDIATRIEDFTKRRYLWWACNKLLRKKFLIKNNIKFPQMSVFEDLIFSFQCVVLAKNYVRVPFVSYNYRIRKNSMSRSYEITTNYIRNFAGTIDFFDSFITSQKIFNKNPNYKYLALDFFIQLYLKNVSENLFVYSNLEIGEIYDILYKEVFAMTSEKGAALSTYNFITMNLYRILIDRQAEEIAQLKKLLQKK